MQLYVALTLLALLSSAIASDNHDGMTREEIQAQRKAERQAANRQRRIAERMRSRSPSPSPDVMVECDVDEDCEASDMCEVVRCVDHMCVAEPLSCDDGNMCTTDVCDPEVGCVYSDVVCDDDDLCTIDECLPEVGCMSEAIVCDDGDLCTEDSCVAGDCVYAEIECVQEAFCFKTVCNPEDGTCVVDEDQPRDCEDGDLCTVDMCDEDKDICVHEEKMCDDGKHCTQDKCDSNTGECVYHQKSCPIYNDMDNWKCLETYCSENHGGECQYHERSCNDGDDCTRDLCSHGRCLNVFMTDMLKDKKFAQVCAKSKKAPKTMGKKVFG